ncbi:uncharacterized protein GGS22DRAFT_193701 [Annulohypoxylon maeteangense]|uniref:uncharacterized protein n=1 Tax=Annulohypoxylon maeteangense TaxID=1927788 RepID=UPI0020087541|nr:uncharacterized protein GGS22DRAFT_193701 [Annulohypoxylon maeteangense]KAI0880005.1 hypothetical protein GGS22DRAFT_193701 [Annulohypoxylon maeteangense]
MPRYSPLPTNLRRSHSVNSVATSDSTYHSFHDIELYEPSVASPSAGRRMLSCKEDKFEFKPILRHDSGYESIHPKTRAGSTTSSHPRRNSTISTTSSHSRLHSHSHSRTRPSIRRAAKSSPNIPLKQLGAQPMHSTNSQQPTTYYYFPPPESLSGSHGEDEDEEHDTEPSYPPPPQTTHYWTSDHTRRLEYAAIDAASRGVKGWFMKHVVPDCFVPKASRRVGFDDDSGSVRRYRLELDCDEAGEKNANGGKKMGWLLGR